MKELQERLKSLKPFKEALDIPTVPLVDEKVYQEYVVPRFIELGAIPKSQLKDGYYYYGNCRNATIAKWREKDSVFVYIRYKFGYSFPETIRHFEDDDGYDLFVPIRLGTEEEIQKELLK